MSVAELEEFEKLEDGELNRKTHPYIRQQISIIDYQEFRKCAMVIRRVN